MNNLSQGENSKIILLKDKGLCYHPDWPSTGSCDCGTCSSGYKAETFKSISEAVPFADQKQIFGILTTTLKAVSNTVSCGSFEIAQPYLLSENIPYPIPEGHEVKVKKHVCRWCELTHDPKCKGLCKSTKSAKEESAEWQTRAYLIPLNNKEESQEDMFRLVVEMFNTAHKKYGRPDYQQLKENFRLERRDKRSNY